VRAPGAQDPGIPVNPFSRAVNPKLQYPLHFDLLMHELYQRGLVPEHWHIAAAEEVRLDEGGMDVEFVLVEHRGDIMRRVRVDVQEGRLQRITHY
jgi:hypothetical protein